MKGLLPRRTGGRLAVLWLLAVVLAGTLGPLVMPLDVADPRPDSLLAAPGGEHTLGTDEEGRDVVRLLLAGGRTALLVGLSTVIICGLLGTLLGSASGFFGGWLDRIVLSATEAVYAFPGVLLAVFLMFLVPKPGAAHVIAALSVSGWATYARLSRGIALSVRARPYVEAVRALGVPSRRILLRLVLPQTLPHVSIQAAFGIANAILAEAALSFLGLGIADGTSWGAMLSSGAVLYLKAPHLALAPGIVLATTILAVLLLADSLQRRLDPKAASLGERA